MSKYIRFTAPLLIILFGVYGSLLSTNASSEISQNETNQASSLPVGLPSSVERPIPELVPLSAETMLSAPVPEISVQKENPLPFFKPRPSVKSDKSDLPDINSVLPSPLPNSFRNQVLLPQSPDHISPQKSTDAFSSELNLFQGHSESRQHESGQNVPLHKRSAPQSTFFQEELPPLLLEQHDLYSNPVSNADVLLPKGVESVQSINDTRVRQAVLEGIELEQKQLWSDAMRLYEKALKQFSDHPAVFERYRYCRFHYEVAKRYRDASFTHLVNDIPLTEILKIYSDILTRVKNNHVDAPDWKALFQYGLDDLDIAFSDAGFLKANNIQASTSVLEQLRRKIHETADPWSFRHIQDMKNGVLCVAELIQTEIGLKPSVVLMEFTCGASCGLDPYTTFLTRRMLDDFYSMIEGSFIGIGVELDSSNPNADQLTVLKVHPNSPAMQSGLKDGDSIVAVNGTITAGLGTDRAADLLQGSSGSSVILRIRSSEGYVRDVEIVRRKVDVASVEDVHMLNKELGYLRLSCFQASTTQEMIDALNSLQKQGMKALVLDLRNNPGGLLPVAVEVANLFLDNGIIVRTQDRDSQSETIWRANSIDTWRHPLFVLIDEESASASEILAGAIRYHKRGLLIGRQSYGKGTVQIIYRLSGNNPGTPLAGLKLTVERFYTPSGLPYCNVGVIPDIFPPDESGEKVTAAKPSLINDALIQSVPQSDQSPQKKPTPPARRKRISSDSSDPFVAEAMSAYIRTSESELQRLSQRP